MVTADFVPKDRTEKEVTAGRIIIEIDETDLLALLSLYPNGSGQSFNEEEIVEALKQFKVKRGIEVEEIQRVISEAELYQEPVERVVVAKGRAPVLGEDAYLEYPPLDCHPREETDPTDPIEFCKKRIINILEGETVAIHHPLKEGVLGLTVRGETMPIELSTDRTARPGRGLRWEETELVSKVDGRLVLEDKRVDVDEELRITEPLTVVTGDIYFVGKLFVYNGIEAGLNIHCCKDMEVRGSIIGTDVHCEGNLKVSNGIIGSEETAIEVGGDLDVLFVENAILKVWGSCLVRDSFVTSSLLCSQTLDMTRGRGNFVSGSASARQGIAMRTVGIPVGTKVRLSVGWDGLARERRAELEDEIEQLETRVHELRNLERNAGPETRTFQLLAPGKREEIGLLLAQLPAMEQRIEEAQERCANLRTRLAPTFDARVTIAGQVNTDTIVEFPLAWTRVTSALSEVGFRFNRETTEVEMVSAA